MKIVKIGNNMKIKNVTPVGKKNVYDISVEEAEHYVLENGVVTHNTGIYYSSDTIFIIGRQQEKDGTDVIGYNFILNVEKSRFVKEKSKIPLCVSFDGGISKWSGLIDLALESKIVIKPSNGWYQKIDVSSGELLDKKYRLKETETPEFWEDILNSIVFKDFIEKKYKLATTKMVNDEIVSDEDVAEIFSEEE